MLGAGHMMPRRGLSLPFAGHLVAGAGMVPAKPTQRRIFPVSAGEWATRFPTITGLLEIWTFQEGASPVVGRVAGQNLVENSALLYGRAGDSEPRLSAEFDTAATTEFTGSADAAFGDLSAVAPRTLWTRFRCPDNAGLAVGIMGTGSGAAAAGWGLRLNAGGSLVARASDGTTTVNSTSAGVYDNGVSHDGAIVWDRLAGTPALRLMVDAVASVTTALGALSAVDAATGIRAGSIHALNPVIGEQVSYAAYLAAALTDADFAVLRTPQWA